MNERIQELAEQAGYKHPDAVGTCEDYAYFDHEKFAELIVRECLEACSRANEIRHFVPPTQEQVVLSCMREIETTFRS
jgi:cupin superfamily acireductone dioxygenase involved in methionine salvage